MVEICRKQAPCECVPSEVDVGVHILMFNRNLAPLDAHCLAELYCSLQSRRVNRNCGCARIFGQRASLDPENTVTILPQNSGKRRLPPQLNL
jgi:hypothetical protein